MPTETKVKPSPVFSWVYERSSMSAERSGESRRHLPMAAGVAKNSKVL